MENKLKVKILESIKNKFQIELNDLKLTNPPKKELWDIAFNCWILARDLKKNPSLIAEDLKEELLKIEEIDKVDIEQGFINLFISKNIYNDLFQKILSTSFEKREKTKNIVIDYIWANVWKPLHIGHMCTPNQWQVLVNVYRRLWYNVVADSHIWDWGIIFWKLILAFKKWWDEEKLEKDAINHLLELYIKITEEAEKEDNIEEEIREEFKKLSEGNSESVELWKKFTSFSISSMQTQLDRLNVKPNYNIWESFYEWLGLPKLEDYPDLKDDMHSIVNELIEKWIATKNEDSSVWVNFDDELKISSCILQKRDWTHGYLASDLAAIKYRVQNWNPEKIVYFVDSRQQLHLKQAFTIAKLAWWIKETELFHAANWFISLKDWAMSTRKWRIIKLDKLLDEAEDRAKKIILEKRDDIGWEELDKLSKIIGIWAIKYWYLKKNRETDVIFDWDEFMTFEWNSWPYIQYAYVRALRILENFKWDLNIKNPTFEKTEEIELIKILSKYNDILEEVVKWNQPHILAKYSYDLTKVFNSFYNNIHILNEESNEKKISRLKLVELFSKVLKESFNLLGIDMPEKM